VTYQPESDPSGLIVVRTDLSEHWWNDWTVQPCTEFEINVGMWLREKIYGVMYRSLQMLFVVI
jgi:hypothetical protein